MRCKAATFLFGAAVAFAQPVPANISPQAIGADERQRDLREKLPEIVNALGLGCGSVVADMGARYGYFAVRFSKVVGTTGMVYAEEIDAALVKKLRGRFAAERLTNVRAVLGTPRNPHLPVGSVNAILLADVYHDVAEPAELLAFLSAALRPGARLVIVDYLKRGASGKSRPELVRDHNIANGRERTGRRRLPRDEPKRELRSGL